MTKPVFFLIIGMLILAINRARAQRHDKGLIILVDPGHGGNDSGAISTDNAHEKDIVLKITKEMLRLNQEILESPMELYLTRYTDTLISLKDRGLLSRALKASLFVSIHGNHAPNPMAQGIEVFTWSPLNKMKNPFDIESKSLAKAVVSEIENNLGFKYRGIKSANFQVLRDNREQCPAILLEVGFLSNGEEAVYLKSDRGITALATSILIGISKFVRNGGAR
jgi:N-acetylmuramoyl-L-alanine amidase